MYFVLPKTALEASLTMLTHEHFIICTFSNYFYLADLFFLLVLRYIVAMLFKKTFMLCMLIFVYLLYEGHMVE